LLTLPLLFVAHCSRDWFRGYIASHIGKDMKSAVGASWGYGGVGNLSGTRKAEVLQAFSEADRARGESAEGQS